MVLTPENSISFITRIVTVIVYTILTVFFVKGYRKSVERGFANKFLLGYVFFFGFLAIYGVLSVVDEISTIFFETNFFGSLETELGTLYNEIFGLPLGPKLILQKLTVALYLIGIIILMLLLAVQVYPLESMLGWKHLIATKYLFGVAIALGLVFVPFLTNTFYPDIASFAAIFGLFLGLLLNIGINIKIAATTSGDLKRRSIAIIFASLLFYVGFLFTVGIQEMSPFRGSFGSSMGGALDIMLGGILQMVSAVLYWRGLRSSE